MLSRQLIRGIVISILLLSVLSLSGSYLAAQNDPAKQTFHQDSVANTTYPSGTVGAEKRINQSNVTTSPVASAESITVIATQGFYVSDERAELVAISETGNVLYHNQTYRVYFDVDPVEGTEYTVEYVAARQLRGDACDRVETIDCTRNLVERVNLSTGETTHVYSKLTPRVYSARWHDVDRINETHLVVADIVKDRVFIVDTGTSDITWQWDATRLYSEKQGGESGDWTHLNDVEVLADGRLMVNVRNMDQAIFIRPGEGVNTSWTLGKDDNYNILYEPHNPDFIPTEEGGPAVLIGDSENNRIVEYQRTNGTWTRTWMWRDARLQWPRDADRLPNGHTLVVDSHGDRVLELTKRGAIVWNVSIGMPYDAERIGTGDESTNGPSWQQLHGHHGLHQSRNYRFSDRIVLYLKGIFPNLLINGLLYVSPSWIRFVDLLVAGILVIDLFVWGVLEAYWSALSVRGIVSTVHQ